MQLMLLDFCVTLACCTCHEHDVRPSVCPFMCNVGGGGMDCDHILQQKWKSAHDSFKSMSWLFLHPGRSVCDPEFYG